MKEPSEKRRKIDHHLFSSDILRHIVPFIDDPSTVCFVEATCKSWKHCMQSNEYWMYIERDTFGATKEIKDHRQRYLERLKFLFNQRKHVKKCEDGEYIITTRYSERILHKASSNTFAAYGLIIKFYSSIDYLQTQHPEFGLIKMKESFLTPKQNYFITEWYNNESSTECTDDFVIVGYSPDGDKKFLTISYSKEYQSDITTLIMSACDWDVRLVDVTNNTVNFSLERDEVSLRVLRGCLVSFASVLRYHGGGGEHHKLLAVISLIIDSCGLVIDDEDKSNLKRLLKKA
ncbi:VIPR1 [Acrasis kona]|uniref:VIPR1 n=1 Tax=Acrasis kona TaxID=1008807 RepID=A0AAW2ZRS7_9EUKA